MSYILDALRKSDQQRQRGAVPTLLTAQAAPVAPRQPAFLLYGLIAVVLVSAGIAIGWLRPWQPEHTAPAAKPIAAKPPEPDPRQTAMAPLPTMPEMARKLERQQPVQKSTSAAQPAPARAAKRDTLARAKSDAPGTPPKTGAATLMPKQSAGTGPADAAQDQRVMTMAELPLAIQQEIPAMSVSVHAYSDQPRNRLVRINERMLREGGDVAPGLRLEQITPDGMILSYKGYRFSRGVRGSGSKAETR